MPETHVRALPGAGRKDHKEVFGYLRMRGERSLLVKKKELEVMNGTARPSVSAGLKGTSRRGESWRTRPPCVLDAVC